MVEKKIVCTDDWIIINGLLAIPKASVDSIGRKGNTVNVFYTDRQGSKYESVNYKNAKRAIDSIKYICERWRGQNR